MELDRKEFHFDLDDSLIEIIQLLKFGYLFKIKNNFISIHTKQLVFMIDCFFSYLKLDWSDCMNDIFKDMQANVGCEYLSDLPSYKRKVWQKMRWCL